MAPTLLTEDQINEGLEGLSWTREGAELTKTEKLKDFAEALAWVNRVGAIAEAHNHHPDIAISWNTVSLRLSTHSAGGLTPLDLEVAREIDGLES